MTSVVKQRGRSFSPRLYCAIGPSSGIFNSFIVIMNRIGRTLLKTVTSRHAAARSHMSTVSGVTESVNGLPVEV